jgi:hypothetical protein
MIAMARPKRGKAGRPKVANPKRQILSIKGSEEWRDWLRGLADHVHMPATTLIDQALIKFARGVGYDEPMPKR